MSYGGANSVVFIRLLLSMPVFYHDRVIERRFEIEMKYLRRSFCELAIRRYLEKIKELIWAEHCFWKRLRWEVLKWNYGNYNNLEEIPSLCDTEKQLYTLS